MAHATAAFDKNVCKIIEEWRVPALALAVVQDTLFDCASTSKSFTAACVALLVEDEAYPDVQWRTPVSKILPDDFVLPDPYLTANVTIEDILSHRTGDPGHDDAFYGQNAAQPDNAKTMTQNLRHLPFNKPLRTEYQYSNAMYTVATHLIETVTGETYSNFVKKKDMGAAGYHWDKEKGEHIAIPSYAQPEGQGAGCVYSSVSDYARWVRALLQHSHPLSEASHKEMVKGRIIVPFEGNDALPLYGHSLYALGLIVESYRGHALIGHDGAFDGFKALMRYVPGHNWGVVMFGNSDDAFYVLQILFHQLMDELLEVPQATRTDWPMYWKKCEVDEEEEEEKENPELLPPESSEPLPLPFDRFAGEYAHASYQTLTLAYKEGTLEADCTDKGMPFRLRFGHLSGNRFVVERENTLDKSTQKCQAEFDIDDGSIKGLGIPLCDGMKDELI
ncbi:beta-lactamase/transpeptidase-like protein [Lizonia empirigonia]|nr:beta-lactamase/transpeptidase-like protein [Lizonia empirigonia]